MNYRFLGRTGLRVSELCLGAMTFGRENEATEEESRAMMDRFAELGVILLIRQTFIRSEFQRRLSDDG
jgi:aryl-alcohol dehydrogenase-like predicted oxidoreductase